MDFLRITGVSAAGPANQIAIANVIYLLDDFETQAASVQRTSGIDIHGATRSPIYNFSSDHEADGPSRRDTN